MSNQVQPEDSLDYFPAADIEDSDFPALPSNSKPKELSKKTPGRLSKAASHEKHSQGYTLLTYLEKEGSKKEGESETSQGKSPYKKRKKKNQYKDLCSTSESSPESSLPPSKCNKVNSPPPSDAPSPMPIHPLPDTFIHIPTPPFLPAFSDLSPTTQRNISPATDSVKPTETVNMEDLQILIKGLGDKIDRMHLDNQSQFDNTRALISGISENVDRVDSKVDSLRLTVDAHKAENDVSNVAIRSEVQGLRERLDAGEVAVSPETASLLISLKNDVEALKSKPPAAGLASAPCALADEIEKVQQALRRNNIVIRGLKINPRTALKDVNEFLSAKLQVSALATDVHLRHQPNQEYGVITATIESWEAKKRILSAKKCLAGTSISIDLDLTPKQSSVANLIRVEARALKESGRSVKYVRYNSMVLDGTQFRWDYSKQALVKSTRTKRSYTTTKNTVSDPPAILKPRTSSSPNRPQPGATPQTSSSGTCMVSETLAMSH